MVFLCLLDPLLLFEKGKNWKGDKQIYKQKRKEKKMK